MNRAPIALLLLVLFAIADYSKADSDNPVTAIEQAIDNPNRSGVDRDLDGKRKPLEVLSIFKIKRGMKVLDVFGGGGYYSEILSYIVGKDGSVVLYNNKPWNNFVGKNVNSRLENDRLPNVKNIVKAPADLAELDGEFDAAIFILGMHDIYYTDEKGGWPAIDKTQFLAALYNQLKKGAVLGVIDHNAVSASDPSIVGKSLHRVDPEVVISDLQLAGFVLEARSDILASPDDDLSLSVFDAAIKWKTDRSVLRFRK